MKPGLILRGWRIHNSRKQMRVWLLVICPYSKKEWAIPPAGWLTYANTTWICPCCQIPWGFPGVGLPVEEIPQKGQVHVRYLREPSF